MIRSTGSAPVAGPCSTEPSVIRNRLPWQAQSTVPSDTSATRQFWWAQIAEKALKPPCSGRVATTFPPLRITPPPTGMPSVVAGSRPAGPSGAAVPEAASGEEPALSRLPREGPCVVSCVGSCVGLRQSCRHSGGGNHGGSGGLRRTEAFLHRPSRRAGTGHRPRPF
ncbi:hypothetical protein GCM10027162_12960 [Streptomyces incanus]